MHNLINSWVKCAFLNKMIWIPYQKRPKVDIFIELWPLKSLFPRCVQIFWLGQTFITNLGLYPHIYVVFDSNNKEIWLTHSQSIRSCLCVSVSLLCIQNNTMCQTNHYVHKNAQTDTLYMSHHCYKFSHVNHTQWKTVLDLKGFLMHNLINSWVNCAFLNKMISIPYQKRHKVDIFIDL